MLMMSFDVHSTLSTDPTVQIGAACLCCIAVLLKLDLLFFCLPSQEVGIGVIHACLAFPLQHLLRVYDTHIIYDSNLVLRIAQHEGPYPVQPMSCRPSSYCVSSQVSVAIMLPQCIPCFISNMTDASRPTCCEYSMTSCVQILANVKNSILGVTACRTRWSTCPWVVKGSRR